MADPFCNEQWLSELRSLLEEVLDRKLDQKLGVAVATIGVDVERRIGSKDSMTPKTPNMRTPGEERFPSFRGSPDDLGRFCRHNGPFTMADVVGQKEVEDVYEDLYDLTRAFHSLCENTKSTINARELVTMHVMHQQLESTDQRLEGLVSKYAAALKVLNHEFGIHDHRKRAAGMVDEVTLDTFILIMQRQQEIECTLQHTVLLAVCEIRDILLREDACRKVAKATNMNMTDLHLVSGFKPQTSQKEKLMKYMDPFIGFVIIVNALVICISTDVARGSSVWSWLEIVFTTIFIVELSIKVFCWGAKGFFLGGDMVWNCFDTVVVLMATMEIVTRIDETTSTSNLTLIRLMRFARLSRLIRVLKLKIFKELVLMVNGILVGFRTLIWAMIFLTFLLLSLGVLLTQMVGHESEAYWQSFCTQADNPQDLAACESSAQHMVKHRQELFGNVFRSVFTVFRCFTDGCTSVDGTPLVTHLLYSHGASFAACYMVVTLFVLFGLFNLVMAVFVENTIASAKRDDAKRREAQWNEHIRVAQKLQEVIVMFCRGSVENPATRRNSSPIRKWYRSLRHLFCLKEAHSPMHSHDLLITEPELMGIKVTHESFMKVLENPEVQDLLDDLDIDFHSRRTIFDVLDANGNGTLEVTELVQGLLRLRGVGDRSDPVATLLAIRSIQKSLKAMEVLGLHQGQVIQGVAAAQRKLEQSLLALRAPTTAIVAVPSSQKQQLEKAESAPEEKAVGLSLSEKAIDLVVVEDHSPVAAHKPCHWYL